MQEACVLDMSVVVPRPFCHPVVFKMEGRAWCIFYFT